MASLQEFMVENQKRDIFAIAQYIEAHIALNWQTLIHKNIDKLVGVFNNRVQSPPF